MVIGNQTMSNIRASVLRASAAGACILALALQCSCSNASDGDARSTGSGGAASQASGATGGNSAARAGSGGTTAGNATGASGSGGGNSRSDAGANTPESCSDVGSTRACCNGGTQTCGGNGEFAAWGPCQNSGGATVSCTTTCKDDEFGHCDGGMDSGVDSGLPDAGRDSGQDMPDAGCGAGMECKPGAIRYCDDPAAEWTMSTCDPTGTWGPCVLTTVPNGAIGLGDCSPTDYSPEMCCPQLFLCCQNDPFGAFEDWGSGACAAVSCP
jgi:hypothetical protein